MSTFNRIEEIVEKLNIYNYENIDPESPSVLRYINELEDIARSNQKMDENFNELVCKTRVAYSNWEFAVEKARAFKMLEKAKDDFKESVQIARTYNYAEEEGIAANVTEDSSLLFVGSGWVPESAIAFYHTFHCMVTCVDCNPEAVDISQRVIRRIGLEGRIKVIQSEASIFDYCGYSHIELAVMALPKKNLLKRIKETSMKDAKVICRTVEGSRSLLYTPVLESDMDGFNVLGVVRAKNPNTIVNSIILGISS